MANSTAKFLRNVSGRVKEIFALKSTVGAADAAKLVATNDDGIVDPTLVNATIVSAGAADSGKIPQLDATGKIDSTVLPTGVGAETKSITSTENLAAGNWVNVYDGGAGAFRVRKADATTEGKECNGFVLAATTSGNPAVVYSEGTNNQVSGMVPGPVYLHTTAGAGTATSPSAAGNVSQVVGWALSAIEVSFEPQSPITIV